MIPALYWLWALVWCKQSFSTKSIVLQNEIEKKMQPKTAAQIVLWWGERMSKGKYLAIMYYVCRFEMNAIDKTEWYVSAILKWKNKNGREWVSEKKIITEHVHVHDIAFKWYRTKFASFATYFGVVVVVLLSLLLLLLFPSLFIHVPFQSSSNIFMSVIDCSMILWMCMYVSMKISGREENAVRSKEKNITRTYTCAHIIIGCICR